MIPGSPIEIYTSGVIDGNSAIIDMQGSKDIRALHVFADNVTIKNLTIKNAKYFSGSAICFAHYGNVINCNFINNTAIQLGGALDFQGKGNVINCNFTNNSAGEKGGAINAMFYLDVTANNCRFNTNSDTVYNIKEINCTHLESNNKKNIIFNLTFKNNMFIFEGLPVNATGKVNITLNGKKYNMTFTNVDLNRTITLENILPDEYNVTVAYSGDDNFINTTANATLTVSKLNTNITCDSITTIYNSNDGLTITLADINGKPLPGVTLAVDLNGIKNYTTDENGTVKISVKGFDTGKLHCCDNIQ